MKCQIKIITDKELERGNFETHVPSHHWLLNMRQSLPVGLQAKKTLHLPQSAEGARENCTKDLKPTQKISASSGFAAQEPQNGLRFMWLFKTHAGILAKPPCVNSYMYDGDFLAFQKMLKEKARVIAGKAPSASSQDTFLCSSFTLQPAAHWEQSSQISLGHILPLFIKDQIWVFSKYGLPTYLRNINWIKIAMASVKGVGASGTWLFTAGRTARIMWKRGQEPQGCRGDKLSSSAAAPMFCSTQNTNPDPNLRIDLPAQPQQAKKYPRVVWAGRAFKAHPIPPHTFHYPRVPQAWPWTHPAMGQCFYPFFCLFFPRWSRPTLLDAGQAQSWMKTPGRSSQFIDYGWTFCIHIV